MFKSEGAKGAESQMEDSCLWGSAISTSSLVTAHTC